MDVFVWVSVCGEWAAELSLKQSEGLIDLFVYLFWRKDYTKSRPA